MMEMKKDEEGKTLDEIKKDSEILREIPQEKKTEEVKTLNEFKTASEMLKEHLRGNKYSDIYNDLFSITDEDFYESNNKKVPNSKVIQIWANQKKISTEIIDVGKDDLRAWARVRGWTGYKDFPYQVKDAFVSINFKDEALFDILNKLEKEPEEYKVEWKKDSNGQLYPHFESEEYQLKHLKYMTKIRIFAERICVTKAEKIVNRKLLSMDSREEPEVQFENDESIKSQK